MKKSVILVIAVVYLLSIIFIGFFGLNPRVYNETVYVNNIECLSEEFHKYDINNSEDIEFIKSMGVSDDDIVKIQKGEIKREFGYINCKYVEGLVVNLKCIAKPDDASNKKLKFTSTSSNITVSDIKEDGTVDITFISGGTAYVNVQPDDGSDVVLTIRIRASKINIG